MIVLRALRRRVHFILGPIVGIALTGYFAYHLVEGERGFKAWLRLNREIRTATANLEAVRAQLSHPAPFRVAHRSFYDEPCCKTHDLG